VVLVTAPQLWQRWTDAATLVKWFTPAPWKTIDAQIDAQPGGPLVNSRGELIGINTLASSGLDEGVWNVAVDSAVLCVSLIICDD